MNSLIGRKLGGRYILQRKVGGGGMAMVFKAQDELLNRYVAVKLLNPGLQNDEDFIRRFRHEAQAAAGLSHPNIVGVYDVGRDEDLNFIVMEYIEGLTLKDIIDRLGPLPTAEVLEITRQIAEALRVAHRHGIVHRDIKPHNIMIGDDGRVKVTDFGIARASSAMTVTQSTGMMGSVHYISPEQARGGIVGERADLYSLGVVMFEMATGQVPFTGDTMFSVALKHLQEQAPAPEELNKDVPPQISRITKKLMAKEQHNRYQSAEELLADVNAAIREVPAKPAVDHLVAKARELKKQPEEPEVEEVRMSEEPVVKKPDPKGPAHRGPSWVGVSVISLVLIILAGAALLGWMFWPKPVVVVPSVVGMNVTDAQRELTRVGLKSQVVGSVYSDQPANFVVLQDPGASKEVRSSRMVNLTLSKGVEFASVPDVVGLPLIDAQVTLENAGFKLGTQTEAFSATVPEGQVIEQFPRGGTQPKGTEINVTVSKGPETIPAPGLVGMQIANAVKTLTEAGLQQGSLTERPSDQAPGTVLEQNPVAGEPVAPGGTVDLVIAATGSPRLIEAEVTINFTQVSNHVQVYITDINGERLVYDQTRPQGTPSETFRVSGYGESITVRIFRNGALEKESVIK